MAILCDMEESENKYLQKVNLNALKKETGMSLEELAALADIGPKVIYKWQYMHKDSSRPSYDAFVKLFQAGASVETLFGVEYKAGIKVVEKPASEDQVEAAVKKVLAGLGKTP